MTDRRYVIVARREHWSARKRIRDAYLNTQIDPVLGWRWDVGQLDHGAVATLCDTTIHIAQCVTRCSPVQFRDRIRRVGNRNRIHKMPRSKPPAEMFRIPSLLARSWGINA